MRELLLTSGAVLVLLFTSVASVLVFCAIVVWVIFRMAFSLTSDE